MCSQRFKDGLSTFPGSIIILSMSQENSKYLRTYWRDGLKDTAKSLKKALRSSKLESSEQLVPKADDIDWPTTETIKRSQQDYDSMEGKTMQRVRDEDGIWMCGSKIWIPQGDVELKLKLLVIAHCGSSGHRGIACTLALLGETLIWSSL